MHHVRLILLQVSLGWLLDVLDPAKTLFRSFAQLM